MTPIIGQRYAHRFVRYNDGHPSIEEAEKIEGDTLWMRHVKADGSLADTRSELAVQHFDRWYEAT